MLNYGVFKCKLGGFEVAVKTASQKIKIKDLIQINVIFVHGRLSLKLLEKSVKVENLPCPLLGGQPLKLSQPSCRNCPVSNISTGRIWMEKQIIIH